MSQLEKKLQEELKRFNQINKYAKKMIMEQDVPEDPAAAAPGAVPPAGDVPAGDVPAAPPTGDAPAMPPTGDAPAGGEPPVGGEAPIGEVPVEGDETEEMDITDLVNMTKSIKRDMENKQTDNMDVINKMDDIFGKLDDLESKLANMDSIIDRIDQIGAKVEQMKEPTPVEKLEMRSLDSYPFNKKPEQFFQEKRGEMERTGKNYEIKPDEASNYSKETIMKTFNPEINDENVRF